MSKKKTLKITLDCQKIYSSKEDAKKIIELDLQMNQNRLFVKNGSKYLEVGILEQITIDDYCQENNIPSIYIYSQYKDLYRISFQKSTIDEYFYKKNNDSIEKLSLIYGYLILKGEENRALYTLCPMDYDELPESEKELYREGIDSEFVLIENKKVWPNYDYKIEFN